MQYGWFDLGADRSERQWVLAPVPELDVVRHHGRAVWRTHVLNCCETVLEESELVAQHKKASRGCRQLCRRPAGVDVLLVLGLRCACYPQQGPGEQVVVEAVGLEDLQAGTRLHVRNPFRGHDDVEEVSLVMQFRQRLDRKSC